MVHPPLAVVVRDSLVPSLPANGRLSDVMLLAIGIVGTTVAPWQLFFQQSYVIDKRITPRFISYERADLCIGIGFVMVGAIAMMALGCMWSTCLPGRKACSGVSIEDARGFRLNVVWE